MIDSSTVRRFSELDPAAICAVAGDRTVLRTRRAPPSSSRSGRRRRHAVCRCAGAGRGLCGARARLVGRRHRDADQHDHRHRQRQGPCAVAPRRPRPGALRQLRLATPAWPRPRRSPAAGPASTAPAGPAGFCSRTGAPREYVGRPRRAARPRRARRPWRPSLGRVSEAGARASPSSPAISATSDPRENVRYTPAPSGAAAAAAAQRRRRSRDASPGQAVRRA